MPKYFGLFQKNIEIRRYIYHIRPFFVSIYMIHDGIEYLCRNLASNTNYFQTQNGIKKAYPPPSYRWSEDMTYFFLKLLNVSAMEPKSKS